MATADAVPKMVADARTVTYFKSMSFSNLLSDSTGTTYTKSHLKVLFTIRSHKLGDFFALR